MYSGKYNDIHFQMKITYPLVPYPHTYIARFAPFTWMVGCVINHKGAKRVKRHTQYKIHLNRTMRIPSPGRSIAGPSGQVSSQEGQNNHPV